MKAQRITFLSKTGVFLALLLALVPRMVVPVTAKPPSAVPVLPALSDFKAPAFTTGHAQVAAAPPTVQSFTTHNLLQSNGITKTVTPTGEVAYGDALTYTLIVSAALGTQLGLYDPLTGTTFMHFVEQPDSNHSEMQEDGIILDYHDEQLVGLTILDASQR